MTILPVDEINALEDTLKVHFGEDGRIKSRQDAEAIIDELEDLFLLAYAMGVESVGAAPPPLDTVRETVYRRIDGRTWEDRVWDYYTGGGTLYDITRIAATEAHRDTNAGAYDAAVATGKTKKVWHCMMLDTSRDDHVWLDGVEAPLDGYFYAPGGERTLYPGQWGVPEQDCNCMCWLTYE